MASDSNSTPNRTILVIGATGKQGRSFIRAATSFAPTSDSESPFHILALTRNPTSPSSKALSAKYPDQVSVVYGDLDKPETVRKVFEDASKDGGSGVWGVFVVLAFPGLGADSSGEEKQGKLIASLAHEFKVSHFVFSSVERGGEEHDDLLMLDRKTKAVIERHIKSLDGLSWTIVLPGFFMENYSGALGNLTVAVLRAGLKPDTRLLLIAVDDIGPVVHAIFQNHTAYRSATVPIVGDALTTSQQAESYLRGTGKAIPASPAFVARLLLSVNKHTKQLITDMENVYLHRQQCPEKADDIIACCREIYPGMHTFEMWARDVAAKDAGSSAAGGDQEEGDKNWNKLSLKSLFLGK